MKSFTKKFLGLSLTTLFSLNTLYAVPATWTGSTNSTLTLNTNWTPSTVPSGDVATFDGTANNFFPTLTNNSLSLTALDFNNVSTPYTYYFNIHKTGATPQSLNFTGSGISNSSGSTQTFSFSKTGSGALTLEFGNNAFSSGSASDEVDYYLTNTNLVFDGFSSGESAYFNCVKSTINLNGGATQVTMGKLQSDAATSINLNNNALTIGYISDAPSSIAGNIDGIGGIISKVGPNSLTLSGNNTYSGLTSIAGGTLIVSDDSSLGSGFTDVQFGGNVDTPTLQINAPVGGFISNRYLSLISSIATIDTQLNSAQLNGNITSFSGTSAIRKIGDQTLILTGTNFYNSPTILEEGTLSVSSQANLPTQVNFVTGPTGSTTSTLEFTATNTFNNDLLIDPSFTANVSVISAASEVTLNGSISTSSSSIFNKTGPGTLILGGINTYNAQTNVVEGTLQAGSTQAFSPNSDYIIYGGATLALNDNSNAINLLNSTGVGTAT